ncbi:MAG: helix-turn-helix transcriptional regulator [Mariprofundaceae bacterium]|nr:helix-turn-helix transcriptional regulator [Mariprofundaceae bacterium]
MKAKAIIGRHIRKQRSAQRPTLSINKLAILAEVDSGQLSRAERGLSGLSIDALQRIANVLHISLGSLLDADQRVVDDVICEPSEDYQIESSSHAVSNLTQIVWKELNHKGLLYSHAEKQLIEHQIRSAIEEGIHRGKIRAEYEVEVMHQALLNKK